MSNTEKQAVYAAARQAWREACLEHGLLPKPRKG